MKLIDAHLHFCPTEPYFTQIAHAAHHENSEEHLQAEYARLELVAGVVMGNRSLSPDAHVYPPFLRYCVGLDHRTGNSLDQTTLDLIERNLKRDECVGIKLYPGYCPRYVTDPLYEPLYDLAKQYRKPVAVHTGATAGSNALLKYSHPFTLDEVAVLHPQVQFVMCHFGNPFLSDAAAVVSKNENVAADLSGILEGWSTLPQLLEEQEGYFALLKTWIAYCGQYDRFLFGTDWPLANLETSIALVRYLIPERHHEAVFFDNANRIYQLGL